MTPVDNVQYIAEALTAGSRDDGTFSGSDGRLDIGLSVSETRGTGAIPEQLLAAAWSVCLVPSVEIVACRIEVKQLPGMTVGAEVDLCRNDDGLFLHARINLNLLGVQPEFGGATLRRIAVASGTETATAA